MATSQPTQSGRTRKPRRADFTTEEQAEICRRFTSGEPVTSLSLAFDADFTSVYKLLKRKGCPVHGKARAYTLNEEAFAKVEGCEEAEYFVGLMLADGYVLHRGGSRIVNLQLSGNDRVMVERFREFLSASNPITETHPRAYFRGRLLDSQPSFRLAVFSARLVADLARYGVVPQKSHVATAVESLASSPWFWRGVVDGDGSICITKAGGGRYLQPVLRFVGSRPLVEQFQAFARGVSGTNASVFPQANIFSLLVAGKPAIRLIRALYENATIALPRKLARAQQILSDFRHLE